MSAVTPFDARDKGWLDHAAAQLQVSGGQARTVAGDGSDPRCRQGALAFCPEPDILVTNVGGPPPGDFRDWEHEDWIRAPDLNMSTPIAFMLATVDGMIAQWFGRIVNIVSSSVKAAIEQACGQNSRGRARQAQCAHSGRPRRKSGRVGRFVCLPEISKPLPSGVQGSRRARNQGSDNAEFAVAFRFLAERARVGGFTEAEMRD